MSCSKVRLWHPQVESKPGHRTREHQNQTIKMRRHTMKRTIIIITCLLLAGFNAARAQDVKEIWEKNCQKCHGPDGKGDTKMGKKVEVKDYTNPTVQAAMKDDEMAKAIK